MVYIMVTLNSEQPVSKYQELPSKDYGSYCVVLGDLGWKHSNGGNSWNKVDDSDSGWISETFL